MDSLETLISKKQYEIVIKATENCTDSQSLFYRVIAFASMSKFDDALTVINNHKKILEEASLNVLINLHIDILLLAERFDEAFSAYDYYRDLPYHSQIVEEIIASIPSKIQETMKKTYRINSKDLTEDEIKNSLKGEDINKLFMVIENLKGGYFYKFINEIKSSLINCPKQKNRSFLLMFLVEEKFDQTVSFLTENGLIEVNPSKLEPPFKNEDIKNIEKKCFSVEKDVTFTNTFLNIFSSIQLYIYPNNLSIKDDLNFFAIYILTKKAIMQSVDVDKICALHNLDQTKLEEKLANFDRIIKDF